MIRIERSGAPARVTVTAGMQHLCPYVDEVDLGAVAVSWDCDGSTLELHSLREYLDGFADSRISHEALTARIRDDLSSLPGIAGVVVESTWNTARMEVRCSTSQTPAAPM